MLGYFLRTSSLVCNRQETCFWGTSAFRGRLLLCKLFLVKFCHFAPQIVCFFSAACFFKKDRKLVAEVL